MDTATYWTMMELAIGLTVVGSFIATLVGTVVDLFHPVIADPKARTWLRRALLLQVITLCLGVFSGKMRLSPTKVGGEVAESVAEDISEKEFASKANENSPTTQTPCGAYPRNRTRPSAAQEKVGLGQSNWFPVVASIYDLEKARKKAQEIRPSARGKNWEVHVYETTDYRGKQVWAITLGGYLSQEEAEKRVCAAQGELKLARDAYAWASTRWGMNLASAREG